MKPRHKYWWILAAMTALLPAWGQEAKKDLGAMSIENLMNIEVTSVSRKEQKLSQIASAVFVITQDDIRRSGATNIPDILRMVPGMDVAQINSDSWAITARGFNERFGNELLVMIDGRAVYSPTFGGAFWEVLDLPLDNIDRIEVIRGPGGSIWGANAVNGVVNILTKKASDTLGTTFIAGGGNVHQGFGTVQYGGQLRKSTAYRIYLKYLNESQLEDPGDGRPNADGWHQLRAGFRADSILSPKDSLSFQGDLYTGREGLPSPRLLSVTSPGPVEVDELIPLSGGFLQGKWNHQFSPRSAMALNVSYDRYVRVDALNERRGTFDIEFQHNFSLTARHEIVWGLDYRHSSAVTKGSFDVFLDPPDHDFNLFTGFVQDQIALLTDRLYLTVGIKLEDHYYSGFGAMPSARLAWMVNTRNTLWTAISRALRTPADTDVALRVNIAGFPGPGGTPALLSTVGNPGVLSETLIAYEAGYRAILRKNLSLDLAVYYNQYGDQATSELGAPFFEASPAPAHFVFPLVRKNLMSGETHGLEAFATWKPTERWTLSPGYAFERIHMHLDAASADTQSVADAEGSSPVHSAQLRSHLVLPRGLSWDVSAYFVGRVSDQDIPSYTRVDTQVSWQCTEKLTLSAVGQNLVRAKHLEFTDSASDALSSLMKRSAYAKLTWRF